MMLRSALRWMAAGLLALAAAGCSTLPSQEGREPSFALRETGGTPLGEALAPLLAAHPAKTGVHPMPDGRDAFAARVAIAGAAQRSLDAQYYIWHGDQTGLLLLDALVGAARRGVRVRLLLDDQNTAGIEALLAPLTAQPNLELRLYNPFATRGGGRMLGFVTEFGRLNRRMHNKSFIADNQVAVMGGRNVGNEYFGAGEEIPFRDLDVVAIGAAVRDVSAQFDLFWNSASAYPAERLVGAADEASREALARRLAGALADPVSRSYLDAVRATALVADIVARRVAWEWADARLVNDDPAKTLDPEAGKEVLLLGQLMDGTQRPKASLDMISPYFVPGERGTEFLEGLAASGVRIRVLTNSLASSEAAVVHSGYAKRRCRLARAGVRLYEFRPEGGAADKERHDAAGSSSARLHAKTFAADGKRIFVGSFNFDPRSALLNTEMGLVIASPLLAGRLAALFEREVPALAYEVRARPEGDCVEWIERTGGGEVRHDTEPGAGWAKRAWLGFLSILPLDWML